MDVVRCRRNGLANAPFPLPILRPADGVEPVDGVLPDLGFVEGCCDARQSCLNLLPYVGPGWYLKVSLAAMLDLGVCRWDHIVLGISARSHVDAATLRRALERMDAAWPDGEEHMAKLSVNAMIGLWARSTEVVRAQQQQRAGRRGRGLLSGLRLRGGHGVGLRLRHRRLLSNGTYRPIHDAVLGFEHCMAAKARRILRLPGAGEDGLPADAAAAEALHGAAAGAGGAAPPGRHAGLPRRRDEAVAGQQPGAAHGGGAAQTTEVERGGRPYKPLPGGHRPAGHRKDAPGPDHCGEAVRAGRGGAPGVQDALLRAEPGPGGADGRPLGAQVRARGQRAKAGLAGGLGGPGLRGAERRREVPAAGRLPAVPAVLDSESWAGRPISAPLEHSQLIRDLAGGHRHELTENMRSDPGIFNFVKWLRVEACPTLEQAKPPSPGGRTPRWSSATASAWP